MTMFHLSHKTDYFEFHKNEYTASSDYFCHPSFSGLCFSFFLSFLIYGSENYLLSFKTFNEGNFGCFTNSKLTYFIFYKLKNRTGFLQNKCD